MAQWTNLGGAAFANWVANSVLVDARINLFKSSLIPTPSTTFAQFEVATCDFSGYSEITDTTWSPASYDPAGGFTIFALAVNFNTAVVVTVGNMVGGWYLSGSPTEVPPTLNTVLAYNLFPEPIPMQVANQGFVLDIGFNFARNS